MSQVGSHQLLPGAGDFIDVFVLVIRRRLDGQLVSFFQVIDVDWLFHLISGRLGREQKSSQVSLKLQGCAPPEVINLGVAHELFDWIFPGIAVTSKYLYSISGHAHRHFLGVGSTALVQACSRCCSVRHDRGTFCHLTSSLNILFHISEHEGNPLVLRNWLIESLPFERVSNGMVERRPRYTDATGSNNRIIAPANRVQKFGRIVSYNNSVSLFDQNISERHTR